MGPDEQLRQAAIEEAAQGGAERISRLREAAMRFDTQPSFLAAARGLRRWAPRRREVGDPLSTAGPTPVQVVGRSASALGPARESGSGLGLAGLRFWQSLFEAAGRGRGELEMAIVFTGLMELSSWALEAGDAATLELLREVGSAAETSIVAHEGRIVSGSVTA